jgi:hypothetical protein
VSAIFADAVNVLLTDPSFSVPGTFTAKPSGTLINCRAIIAREDPEIRVGTAHALAPAWSVVLNQAEVPTRPKQGDIVGILDGPWTGTYVVHRTNEDTFPPQWDLEVGGRATIPLIPVTPGVGESFLRPRVGTALTILDATHVKFPEVPDVSGVIVFVNNLPLRPVSGSPGRNESYRPSGSDTAQIGPNTLDPLLDVAWALYFV